MVARSFHDNDGVLNVVLLLSFRNCATATLKLAARCSNV